MNFIKNIAEKYICEYYVIKRQKAISYDSLTESETQSNEFVYSDLVGSLSPTEFNNCRYFITFKNDFISYSKVYCIRHKSETFIIFLRFKAFLESRDYKIYRIRLDNEREYMFKTFLNYLLQCEIRQKLTVPGNPEMNETIERFEQTLLYKMYPILLSSQLNKSFWSEIVVIINYLMLRSLNVRIIVTLFETFHYRKFILSHLRTIDFIVYALKRIQKKLMNKSEKCVLLRYKGKFIFRLYNLIKKKIIWINNVHFVEKRLLIVNLEEKTNAHEFSTKRQRLYVPISAIEKTLNEQRIINISKDIALIIKFSTTASASAINRSRSNFLWSAEKQTSTSKPSSLARAVSPVAFARVSRSIATLLAVERITRSLTVVEMIHEDLELSAIQRVLLDHFDTTISNLWNLSSNPLSRTFATFALLTNHVNKSNIFEPTTY